MQDNPPAPYWRLSLFYFFYFASLGALLPYWGLYLQEQGFSVSEIGEVMAVIMGTKIVAPNIWGWIADHTGKHIRIIRIASLLSVIAFAGVYFDNSYLWIVFVMLVFSFFWNANLPQFEATTLVLLGKKSHQYSNIRLWGSIGFILAVVTLGVITERQGASWVPIAVVILLLGVWLISLATKEVNIPHDEQQGDRFFKILRRTDVIALLAVCFLLQASHGPYYAFYSIYLEENGYTRTVIGQLWALGVLAEVVVFMFMYRLLPRFGAKNLLIASLVLSAVRWSLIGTSVENHGIMIFAQLLHAASFGLYHAVAIHLIHRIFSGRLAGRGQALYSSLSFGAGGAVGALYSGYVWESGGAVMAYGISTVLCLIAVVIAVRAIHVS